MLRTDNNGQWDRHQKVSWNGKTIVVSCCFFFFFLRVVHNHFFFFSLFVWPHATSRILRTSEKKQGSVRISRKCDGVGKVGDVKPQDYIQEKLSRITKRKWEVTLYLSEGELGRTDENITWTQYFSWPVRLRASFDLHKKKVKKHLLNSGSLFFFPPQTSSFFFSIFSYSPCLLHTFRKENISRTIIWKTSHSSAVFLWKDDWFF